MPKTQEQIQSRITKRPFFTYLYAYCIVRDLTEQEALEEIADYSGANIDVLRASITNQDSFNSLPTSVTIKISFMFNLTMQSMVVSNGDEQHMLPMSFEISDFQVNLNKYKWFKQSLRDDKRFAKKPSEPIKEAS